MKRTSIDNEYTLYFEKIRKLQKNQKNINIKNGMHKNYINLEWSITINMSEKIQTNMKFTDLIHFKV